MAKLVVRCGLKNRWIYIRASSNLVAGTIEEECYMEYQKSHDHISPVSLSLLIQGYERFLKSKNGQMVMHCTGRDI